jgi:hypothetical protein
LLQSGEIESISLGGKARLISVRSIHEWADRQLSETGARGMLGVMDRR